MQTVLNTPGGAAGICKPSTDCEWHVFNKEPCSACSVTTINNSQDMQLVPGTDLQPINVTGVNNTIAALIGEYNSPVGDFGTDTEYCLRLENTTFDPLECINHDGILPPNVFPPLRIPVVYVANQSVDLPPTPRISMDLNLSYRYIEGNTTPFQGPGVLDYYWPTNVNLTTPNDMLWWLENGNQTRLDLDLVLYADAAVVDELHVVLPYLVQVMRARVKSAEETHDTFPFP
jgi:hypothetical protein